MEKTMGILLMVIFGISGAGAAALAWLIPSLHLDKTEATLAGLIGIGFFIAQSRWLKHPADETGEIINMEVPAEDKN